MRDDDRQRIGMAGAHVNEVDVHPIDVGRELRQGVQLRLYPTPVVAASPVPNQRLQLRELRALRLIDYGFLVGPSRSGNAPAEVIQCGLRYMRFERAD